MGPYHTARASPESQRHPGPAPDHFEMSLLGYLEMSLLGYLEMSLLWSEAHFHALPG
jgi:hypothetical protein